MSGPWDEERRRPPPENDSEWPERDLWQSWDRPAEPEPEAGTEVPWADTEGDELWSDTVGSRPVSATSWTGPTWDDQPWAEPSPGERRPDLSAFIAPAEVAEAPAELEEAPAEVGEGPAEVEPQELQPPEAEPREPEPQEPEPREPEPREPEPQELQPPEAEPREPEPQEPEPARAADGAQPALGQRIRAAWESLGLSEPTTAPTWTPEPDAEPASTAEPDAEPDRVADAADFAEPAAEPAWSEPEPEPAWGEPEPAAQPAWPEPEATAESAAQPAWGATEATAESAAQPAWSATEATAESAAQPAWSEPEPVSGRFEDQVSAPAEPLAELPEQAEPTEQAFAAFAPQREPEFVREPAAVVAEALPAREPEPEPDGEPQPSRPYEPFEVIDGGAMAGSIDTPAGDIETTLGAEDDWDGRSERRQPTTAEQVVPWLIGVILLLVGMVILLVALIFTSDKGLLAGLASPSGGPNDTAGAGVVPSSGLAGTPRGTASSSTAMSKPSSGPTPPPPTFGPLDMVYLGRSAALAHIYLLRHDFTADVAPVVLAQDPAQDVEHLSSSADGTHGAAIIDGRLITIEGSKPKRALADGIAASSFAPDGESIYALRIVIGNGTDRAEVLKITYATGAAAKLTEWTYTRPVLGTESAVKEAQFADEGGPERLYWMSDGTLRIWMLGAPTYRVTPTGRTTKLAAATLPVLWSGEGIKRIQLTESGETTTISLRSADGKELAKTTVKGLVSHLRWSPDDSQVVFTLGRSVGGGVQQDLFLWNLSADKPPMQLTNTGAAFGAEWLGAAQAWRP